MKFKMKMACAATVLALGAAAHAERVIVSYDNNGQGLKKGHDVLVEGNGWFAADLNEKGKSAVRGMKGFKKMEKDVKRFPMAIWNDDQGDPTAEQLTPYAVYQSQADQLVLGSGQKVCVIDSGIAGADGETGGKNNDFDWTVITGDNDSGTGDWFRDGGPHGTHVAGTVGAADNGIGVVGMAPGVPMHIIKVFNASGWGYSSDLAYAADKCTQAGANIITMSLGGGRANSIEESAFDTFTANGGLVLAAAGNDGNNVRSYPAGYKSVMMVGANDADNNIADFSQYPGCKDKGQTDDGLCVEVTAGGVDTLSTYPAGGATLSSATIDGAGIASSGMENNGDASGDTYYMGLGDATDAGANGKICVIDRGSISFHDKTANCENSGGIGAIIINNESGMLYGTLGDTNTTTIPVVGTALEDRDAILAATTASVSVGPSDYGYMSGTSMATPAVAGISALVWSNHPSCSGTEIRNALKATAEDQGAVGRDDYFGYGIVKAKAASDYLTANGCTGSVDDGSGDDGGSCKGGPKKCG
ncbi:S8 family serine peptidase [Kangiella shandongensis]|uniref:S8 family serine peptidase n=1 Tax=Kangiella shandongensis TaxID=2763258 RepID=UPI001CBDDE62|nr:S8 family serine peptidase [Kangiella shandongensis]